MPVFVDGYKPTKKQLLFHTSPAKEILYGGAAGGGKSRALVQDAFARCMQWPGFQSYMFRRTYPELELTLIKEAKMIIPDALAKYNGGRHEYVFPNKSAIRFRHCNSEDDRYNYQGSEIHGLYIDELTTFTQVIYDYLKTRSRAAKNLEIPTVIRCGSNPGNVGHGWVKKYFVESAPYGEIHQEKVWSDVKKKWVYTTIQYIPALATDNPHIGDDYIIELERKPKALKDALLFGKWDAFEGQVFLEFKNDPKHYKDGLYTHVIDPIKIPAHWPRYRTFDHGYSDPFCVHWYAMAPSGTSYCYREWYGSNGTPDVGLMLNPVEIAIGILEREDEEIKNNIPIVGLADPAIFDGSRGPSVAEQMRREGVVFSPAERERIPGKMLVHTKLAFDKEGYPGIYFFNTCRDVVRTLPNLPYSTKKNAEDVDTDSEDHAYDCLRYFCAGRAKPGTDAAPPRTNSYDPYREAHR
jgi:hypothetical protein